MTDGFSAAKQFMIKAPALFKSGKCLSCFTLVAVDFPTAAAPAVFSFVFNKACYITERVAKKQTDLVRKFQVRRYPHAEKLQTNIEMVRFIAIV